MQQYTLKFSPNAHGQSLSSLPAAFRPFSQHIISFLLLRGFGISAIHGFKDFIFFALRRSANRPRSGLKAKPPTGGFAGGLGACHQQAENVWYVTFSLLGTAFNLVHRPNFSAIIGTFRLPAFRS